MGVYDTPKQEEDDVSNVLHAFTRCVNEDTLLDLATRFSDTYGYLAKNSTEQFLVTPVTALPTGKEKGRFLAIDVGGTNLRVGFIELMGEAADAASLRGQHVHKSPVPKIKRSYDRSWPIDNHLKMDQAEDLFRWIGDCIAEVIAEAIAQLPASEAMSSPFGDELLLGITFSFPMAQTCLSEATLLPMGKGFAITSDLNLGKMLLAGYARHLVEPTMNGANGHTDSLPSVKKRRLSKLPRIRIAAITNDTVATFASLAYAVKAAPNSRVAMGLIVGTGTNATVPMKIEYLHPDKVKELANPEGVETVVINTEWTINGTDKPLLDLNIKTKWDLELDRNSEAPGFQPFEYMTAGRYLGEIVRLAFVDVISKEIGGNAVPASLKPKNALTTRYLSEVVARTSIEKLAVALEQRFALETSDFWTTPRVKLLQDIARAVQQRSSALIAAASVGLLDCVHDIHIDRVEENATDAENSQATTSSESRVIEELVVAYCGGTVSQYPKWLETCQGWVDILVKNASSINDSKRVVLKEALDGGIIGAGVLAGMTDKIA
jgi:hexokinase